MNPPLLASRTVGALRADVPLLYPIRPWGTGHAAIPAMQPQLDPPRPESVPPISLKRNSWREACPFLGGQSQEDIRVPLEEGLEGNEAESQPEAETQTVWMTPGPGIPEAQPSCPSCGFLTRLVRHTSGDSNGQVMAGLVLRAQRTGVGGFRVIRMQEVGTGGPGGSPQHSCEYSPAQGSTLSGWFLSASFPGVI